MWEDPIVKEIHKIREEYANAFNYDIDAIFNDLQKQETQSKRKVVKLPVKNIQVV